MEIHKIQEYSQCLIQKKYQVILKDNNQIICNLHLLNKKLLLEAATIQVTVLSFKTMIFLWNLLKMQITITEFNIKSNFH